MMSGGGKAPNLDQARQMELRLEPPELQPQQEGQSLRLEEGEQPEEKQDNLVVGCVNSRITSRKPTTSFL